MKIKKYSLLVVLIVLCPMILTACGNKGPDTPPAGSTTFTKALASCGTGYVVTNVVTTQTHVTVPPTHNGKPVIGIGTGAFSGAISITRVTLPNSVITINESALAGLPALSRVTLGNNVQYIGSRAFAAPTNNVIGVNSQGGPLQQINFPNSLSYLAPDALYLQRGVIITTSTTVWERFIVQLYEEYLGQFQTYFSEHSPMFTNISVQWIFGLDSLYGVHGYYDLEGGISLNMTSANLWQNRYNMNTKNTILHEVRHFYQHAMATLVLELEIAQHAPELSDLIDDDYWYLADLWHYNFDNYFVVPSDFNAGNQNDLRALVAYYTQPVEIDANMFTGKFMGYNELYEVFFIIFGIVDPNLFDYDCILTTTARILNFNLNRLPTEINFGNFATRDELFTQHFDMHYSEDWLGFYARLPESAQAEIIKDYEDIEALIGEVIDWLGGLTGAAA